MDACVPQLSGDFLDQAVFFAVRLGAFRTSVCNGESAFYTEHAVTQIRKVLQDGHKYEQNQPMSIRPMTGRLLFFLKHLVLLEKRPLPGAAFLIIAFAFHHIAIDRALQD